MPEAICCCSNNVWLSWKQCHTHSDQVSSTRVLQLASLRSEEVVLKKMPEALSINILSSWKHVIVMEMI